ncbi:MAG: hypothetical protein JEZ00_18525 [Anaerolineaceae bacterium]|nr:hypothetical protein [Anaerolineaceae bacterium]
MESLITNTNKARMSAFWMAFVTIIIIGLLLFGSVSPVSAMSISTAAQAAQMGDTNSSAAVLTGYYGYPTTSIGGVSPDESVTVITYHFPPNRTFTVKMNHYGTLGVNGIEVGTYESGDGGSQEVTFDIPESLKGEAMLAIRFDDSNNYYYAYDWFNNLEGGSTTNYGTGGAYTYDYNYYSYPASSTYSAGMPGMMIKDVVEGKVVKIAFFDIPDDMVYEVLLNTYGTGGASGYEVGKVDTGEDDTCVMSFNIPSSLKYDDKIAVRLQTTDGKHYIYDYFKNE